MERCKYGGPCRQVALKTSTFETLFFQKILFGFQICSKSSQPINSVIINSPIHGAALKQTKANQNDHVVLILYANERTANFLFADVGKRWPLAPPTELSYVQSVSCKCLCCHLRHSSAGTSMWSLLALCSERCRNVEHTCQTLILEGRCSACFRSFPPSHLIQMMGLLTCWEEGNKSCWTAAVNDWNLTPVV